MIKTVGDQIAGGRLKDGSLNSLLSHVVDTKIGKSRRNAVGSDGTESGALSAEELLDQCKCPISLELMRRPVLPSSGQAFDEINLLRWSQSGNTRCPVSGQELIIRKTKMQYTKHHLLRNIIRQQAVKAGVYLPPIEKDQLLADVRKPACVTKALQAVFDDRCLGYLEKDVTMRTLKDLVKRKKQNKLVVEGEDASSVMQLVIRCCLATRKGDLIRYGRKLLRDDLDLWRDTEIIAEVLGLAEDTEHRGDILADIEAKVTATQVGPKEFVKAALRHRSEKHPVQKCLENLATEVLSLRAAAYTSEEWTAEDKGELLNMALASLHSQCVDAGVCCAQTGLGSAKWIKALADLQDLGCSLYRDNLRSLYGSPVHAQALHQIAASPARATLEWHLEQHDSSFVSALSLDHIALAPLPGHHAFGAAMNALDFQDETSTDEDLEDDEDIDIVDPPAHDNAALHLGAQAYEDLEMDAATAELLAGLESDTSDSEGNSPRPQADQARMSQIEADLRTRYFMHEAGRPAQRRRTR